MTNSNTSYAGILKYLMMAASFIIIIAGMKAAQTILVPFLLSVFISIICSPLLFWFRRKGLPMWGALASVIAIVLLAGAMFILLITSSINDFSQSLPVYQETLKEKISGIASLLANSGITLPHKKILEYVDPGSAIGFASNILSGLGNVFSNAFLIFITVIFILLEAATFHAKLLQISGPLNKNMDFFKTFISKVNRYMVIKTWISLSVGVLVTIWLTILGVDYPILWGTLTFIMNFVPVIGSILAAVPAILLAFVQLGALYAILAACGYIVFNIVMENFVEPHFMGKGLGLSTLIIFLSLIFWGWVLGPVGMVLSIPLTMAVKIGFSSSEKTRWIGTLMDSEPIKELFDDDDEKDSSKI